MWVMEELSHCQVEITVRATAIWQVTMENSKKYKGEVELEREGEKRKSDETGGTRLAD